MKGEGKQDQHSRGQETPLCIEDLEESTLKLVTQISQPIDDVFWNPSLSTPVELKGEQEQGSKYKNVDRLRGEGDLFLLLLPWLVSAFGEVLGCIQFPL